MKIFLSALLLVISFNLEAQEIKDSSIVEEYCILRIGGVPFSTKVSAIIDFGQERVSFGQDRLLDKETGKIKRFNSRTDALNYLGRQGWKLVTAVPVIADKTSDAEYVFKKEIKQHPPQLHQE